MTAFLYFLTLQGSISMKNEPRVGVVLGNHEHINASAVTKHSIKQDQ
jgi:hypothetical protein